jgi:hypothetical protein
MEFEVYSIGLCSASVCTGLSIKQAEELLNTQYPTGIASKWELSKDTHFRGGKMLNGCDCPDHPGNKHFLMNC